MNRPKPQLTLWDLLTIGSRGIFLLLLAIWDGDSMAINSVLIAYAILNLGWLVGFAYYPFGFYGRMPSVVLDFLVGALILYLCGYCFYKVGWLSLMPLFSAALNLPLYGLLSVALLNGILHSWLIFTQEANWTVRFLLIVYSTAYLSLGSGFGFLLLRIKRRILQKAPASSSNLSSPQELEGERRRALYRLINTLSATLDYQRVLEIALDTSTQALLAADGSEHQLVSAVLMIEETAEGAGLRVVTARHFTPADQRIVFSANSKTFLKALESDQPTLVYQPMRDAELSRAIALRPCQAAYFLPLRRGLEVYGLLLFGHPRADYFTAERCEILQIIANQAMVAIENALLYQKLAEEKERIVEIQEEARKKLARDLHDGPTQSVSALAMRVNFARRLLERDPRATAEELYKIEELARRTTKEIRHMLFTLRPLVLESQGLIAALQAMAEKMMETYNQKVIVQADPLTVQDLEVNKQSVIFAIAEEAVNNARKHAQADHIWVRLNFAAQDILLLEIVDDGIGFDARALSSGYAQRGSLGMVNMRERTELVNGVFQIDSKPNQGTTVRVWIPLNENAADRLRKGMLL
ncbi:MAG: GAF domain-containing sensor histidine kinase [Anaerolineales bacterium]|nr:GAF domain-containing sensor histidine kinase [Anaerolineales bacterium]